MMVFLPTTGLLMGYFSGKGLPFFGLQIPGRTEPVPFIAKWAYVTHSWVGWAFEYAIPMHVGAAGLHSLQGHHVLKRMNPFN